MNEEDFCFEKAEQHHFDEILQFLLSDFLYEEPLKASLGVTADDAKRVFERGASHGNPPLHNDSYLAEGLWRMNVKDAGLDPFDAIVNDIKAYWKPGKTEAEPFPVAEPMFPPAQ